MKNQKNFVRPLLILGILFSFLTVTYDAQARPGGGRSFGSRGSRGFSSPSRSGGFFNRPNQNQNSPQRPMTPATSPFGGGSFFRSMMGGIAGGFLGGMLFRALGGTGFGQSGFGLIEILLLGGIIFLAFRLLRGRREPLPASASYGRSHDERNETFRNMDNGQSMGGSPLPQTSLQKETAMDLFFQIQGAFANRDISSVKNVLASDAANFLEEEMNALKRAGRINRLENIAVRDSQVVESWMEMGQEFATVQFAANLLDYVVDEKSNEVVQGSKTTPVKFEEYWTFCREPGSPSWKLSAIQQA